MLGSIAIIVITCFVIALVISVGKTDFAPYSKRHPPVKLKNDEDAIFIFPDSSELRWISLLGLNHGVSIPNIKKQTKNGRWLMRSNGEWHNENPISYGKTDLVYKTENYIGESLYHVREDTEIFNSWEEMMSFLQEKHPKVHQLIIDKTI